MSFVLMEKLKLNSVHNGGKMYRLTFFNTDDFEYWELNVSSAFRNYSKWASIVESQNPWGAYTNLQSSGRINQRGKPVLTADSTPVLELPIQSKKQAELLVEKVKEEW